MKSVNYLKVAGRLAEMGFKTPLHYGDTELMTVTTRWVQSGFAKYFRQVLKARNLEEYVDSAWDCDDFSIYAFVEAKICNRFSEGPDAAAGINFGVIWIPGHSVNWAVCSDEPETWEIKFFEPQRDFQTITLTPEQIAGAHMILV